MTVATISERALLIDDDAGAAQTYPCVGGFGTLGEMAYSTGEVTCATDTRPQRKLTGYAIPSNFTLTFEADVGGSPDPVQDFYVAPTTSAPRTVKLTWNTTGTTWYFQIEANIIRSRIITEPGEDGITRVEVEFEPTGSETISYS